MDDARYMVSSRVLRLGIFASILGGAAATAYGLHHLWTIPAAASGWRWSLHYGEIFFTVALLAAVAGLWRGPRIGALVVAATAAIGLGVAAPVLMLVVLGFSAQTLGRWALSRRARYPIDELLIGLTLFGTVFGLLAHFPVNSAGLWGALIALPLLLRWRQVRSEWARLGEWLRAQPGTGLEQRALTAAIVGAAGMHILGSLMPEVGHDALAMHLYVPMQVARHGFWRFDVLKYAWAVMPMLVEWIYTAGYFLAGSHGPHLINAAAVLMLAELTHRTARWAGAGARESSLAVLLFLLTPLVFTESSSLFIEALWSAFLLGGTLAVLRLLMEPEGARADLAIGAVLLGGALAAKAITFTALPVLAVLMLVGAKRWFRRTLLPDLVVSVLAFAAIGAIPYLTAYLKTGNPVFPFFNALFQSPFYPASNFSPPDVFARGVEWNTLFRMTFDSSRYIEGYPGAAGFQWLLLVAPAIVISILAWYRRALLITVISIVWIAFVFHETAYLRYVLPGFALASVLAALLLRIARAGGPSAFWMCVIAVLATVTLNLSYFGAGTYYGAIDLGVITNAHARARYLLQKEPLRAAVDLVNVLDTHDTPVAFFCNSMAGALHGDALYPNWYNPRFSAQIQSASDVAAMGDALASESVEYVLIDQSWAATPMGARVLGATVDVANLGGVLVRRLADRFRFAREVLPSTDFSSGWHLLPGAFVVSGGGVQVTVMSPAYAEVRVQAGRTYRYQAQARCAAGPALGRQQVNWFDANGKFIRASIKVFDCTAAATTYTMDVAPPPTAVSALVYASGQGEAPVVFSRISFRD